MNTISTIFMVPNTLGVLISFSESRQDDGSMSKPSIRVSDLCSVTNLNVRITLVVIIMTMWANNRHTNKDRYVVMIMRHCRIASIKIIS